MTAEGDRASFTHAPDINGVGGRTLRAVCSRNVIWLRVVSSLQLNSQTLAPSIVALTFQEAKDALSLVP